MDRKQWHVIYDDLGCNLYNLRNIQSGIIFIQIHLLFKLCSWLFDQPWLRGFFLKILTLFKSAN
jgi:hypothetical protein